MLKQLTYCILAITCIFVASATADYVELFSETFDAASPNITDAPTNYPQWAAGNAVTIVRTGNIGAPVNNSAVIGSSSKYNEYSMAYAAVTTPAATSETYTLSADLAGYSSATYGSSHNSGIALASASTYNRVNWSIISGSYWKFNANNICYGTTADESYSLPADAGINELVHATIHIDALNNKVWGTLTHSGGTVETPHYSITGDRDQIIDSVLIFQDLRNMTTYDEGVDVDNVVVAYVPEPATLTLLTAGLAFFIRRR